MLGRASELLQGWSAHGLANTGARDALDAYDDSRSSSRHLRRSCTSGGAYPSPSDRAAGHRRAAVRHNLGWPDARCRHGTRASRQCLDSVRCVNDVNRLEHVATGRAEGAQFRNPRSGSVAGPTGARVVRDKPPAAAPASHVCDGSPERARQKYRFARSHKLAKSFLAAANAVRRASDLAERTAQVARRTGIAQRPLPRHWRRCSLAWVGFTASVPRQGVTPGHSIASPRSKATRVRTRG